MNNYNTNVEEVNIEYIQKYMTPVGNLNTPRTPEERELSMYFPLKRNFSTPQRPTKTMRNTGAPQKAAMNGFATPVRQTIPANVFQSAPYAPSKILKQKLSRRTRKASRKNSRTQSKRK